MDKSRALTPVPTRFGGSNGCGGHQSVESKWVCLRAPSRDENTVGRRRRFCPGIQSRRTATHDLGRPVAGDARRQSAGRRVGRHRIRGHEGHDGRAVPSRCPLEPTEQLVSVTSPRCGHASDPRGYAWRSKNGVCCPTVCPSLRCAPASRR